LQIANFKLVVGEFDLDANEADLGGEKLDSVWETSISCSFRTSPALEDAGLSLKLLPWLRMGREKQMGEKTKKIC
jgi:hypothetical protein